MFGDTRSTLSNHSQTTVGGPVESAGTDGFAITVFVMALLELVPFAFGFGIRSGNGPATAGRAADPDYVSGMAVGDCLGADADGGNVIRMACDEQIAEQVDVGNGEESHPGLATLRGPRPSPTAPRRPASSSARTSRPSRPGVPGPGRRPAPSARRAASSPSTSGRDG
ncbi:hypothetical protein ACGFMK_13490 [Amycolatopsis sp. NPDC049252]|uniref:hypothetical protein n=1 Tax=Amycolatopsis sp. NPDC049252 TaxID=3363933 RepID=UPI003710171C